MICFQFLGYFLTILLPVCGKLVPPLSYFNIASKLKKIFVLVHPDFESNLITHMVRNFGVSQITGSHVIFAFVRGTEGVSYQRWSRGHKARGQGQEHKKNRGQGQGQPFRGQTLSRPRTEMLEAKAKDQGHKRKCSPKSQKFFRRSPKKKKKKKVFTKIFLAISVFQKIFQALHKILAIQKIVLSSS